MADLESSAEQTRGQLASLLTQQDELKGLLGRLLESLEGAGLSTTLEANSSIKALSKTVSMRWRQTLLCRAVLQGGGWLLLPLRKQPSWTPWQDAWGCRALPAAPCCTRL